MLGSGLFSLEVVRVPGRPVRVRAPGLLFVLSVRIGRAPKGARQIARGIKCQLHESPLERTAIAAIAPAIAGSAATIATSSRSGPRQLSLGADRIARQRERPCHLWAARGAMPTGSDASGYRPAAYFLEQANRCCPDC
jgi:hypothetical protein